MAIDQFQKEADSFFVKIIDSYSAICFYFYKTAGLKTTQMMRNKALLITQFLGNIGDSMRFIQQEMNNIPSCLIAEGFEKELVRSIHINMLHKWKTTLGVFATI